ncbi:hypothetical protein BVRB_6g145270 [Beta vulgaris subsp. vulgaris]|uniref:DUF4216 domain-containing protein n=1 Tax=Beta vulgaris subsp. vulgaris TaxID=3555 RepID=A0A0J8C6S3_BETVV|nr:hypothetical protein BVRB_6g145270 [Beta vulgaris subsp. vulgaris]
MDWFKEKVELDNANDRIKWLSLGPFIVTRRCNGYFCNGYKSYTRGNDDKCKTQNCGVLLAALTPSFASSKDSNPIFDNVTYYGIIKEIIEIDYWSAFNVVLFKCDWFHSQIDEYGLTRVNFIRKLCSTYDPFVLVSQVHQVFYVEGGIEADWHFVDRKFPIDFSYVEVEYEATYPDEVREHVENLNLATVSDDDISWCREGGCDAVEVLYRVKNGTSGNCHKNNDDFDETD